MITTADYGCYGMSHHDQRLFDCYKLTPGGEHLAQYARRRGHGYGYLFPDLILHVRIISFEVSIQGIQYTHRIWIALMLSPSKHGRGDLHGYGFACSEISKANAVI